MGHQSIVSGYIEAWASPHDERIHRAIADYPYDDVWPFTNIFWNDSPACYGGSVIAFAGSYKQVEEVWSEWLWKFSQLLTQLEAIRAKVYLDCLLGEYVWVLEPECLVERPREKPESFVGQTWIITRAPAQDFSIDPEWIASVERNFVTYKWDKLVKRRP